MKLLKQHLFLFLTLTLMLNLSSRLYAKDYQVELIVFEHLNSNPSPEGEMRVDSENDYPSLINFNAVSRDNLILSEEASKIRGSRNFRLLQHFAWSQEGLSKEEAGSVNLARWIPGVTGAAVLYLNRYLHLDINMQRIDINGKEEILQERRRMRSNETHYIDHPQFGIIARITGLEEEK